jgi:hypothetical protein
VSDRLLARNPAAGAHQQIDVDSYERAIELAGELSAAPGAGGEPIHEWLEVRPFLAAPPTVTE